MYLHTHIYCLIIHNREEVEVIQIFIDRWMGKENVVYIYYSAFKNREGNPAIFNNMDELWGYYVKWHESVTEEQILHDSTYMRSLK